MMSKMKNRKTAVRAASEDLPVPQPDECIVKVLGMRSGNMVEVTDAEQTSTFLCRVPTKFNKMIWIKRDGFLIVAMDDQPDASVRVRAEVKHVLQKEQIKHLKKLNLWSEKFDIVSAPSVAVDNEAANSDDDDDLLRGNRNHRRVFDESESEPEISEADDDQ